MRGHTLCHKCHKRRRKWFDGACQESSCVIELRSSLCKLKFERGYLLPSLQAFAMMANSTIQPNTWTLAYKQLQDTSLLLDIYAPSSISHLADYPNAGFTAPSVPAVIYFHGGGLTVGNRRSWFPTWLQSQLSLVNRKHELMASAIYVSTLTCGRERTRCRSGLCLHRRGL